MTARAGMTAWAAMLCALMLTADPLVTSVAAVSFMLIALRIGRTTVVAVACVAGLLVAVLNPLFVRMGESVLLEPFGLAITWEAARAGVLMGMRLAAVVAVVSILGAIDTRSILHTVARWSHRSTLLAALTVQLGPRIAADAKNARGELRARGVPLAQSPGIRARIGGVALLWHVVLVGLLERAFATAAALDVRGYGQQSPVVGELRSPALRGPTTGAVGKVASIVAAGAALAAFVCALLSGSEVRSAWSVAVALDPLSLIAAAAVLVCAAAILLALDDVRDRPSETGTLDDAVRERPHDSVSSSIELNNVAMRHAGAEVTALTIPRLVIAPGELVLIKGPTGSGKSTLLDVINGMAPHNTGGELNGNVIIGGRDVTYSSARERSAIVATLFQDPERHILMSDVAEEVAFGVRNVARSIDEVDARVGAMLSALGCLSLARRDPATLSGGELQKVMLAAALARHPSVIVLDEPIAQLDEASRRDFVMLVKREHARRAQHGNPLTVVIAEHAIAALHGFVTRTITMSDGQIIDDSTDPLSMASTGESFVPQSVAPSSGVPRLHMHGHVARAGVVLVHPFALQLAAGSVVTIEGANGAGKSSLLRAMRGLHEPRIALTIDGHPVHGVEEATPQIGYLPQHAASHVAAASVGEYAELTCRIIGLPRAQAQHALEQAGLGALSDRHPLDLSVGQRQRVALVGAIAHEPRIVLLDEPTRALDEEARAWLVSMVQRASAAGAVVVIATHDEEFARAVAHQRFAIVQRQLQLMQWAEHPNTRVHNVTGDRSTP